MSSNKPAAKELKQTSLAGFFTRAPATTQQRQQPTPSSSTTSSATRPQSTTATTASTAKKAIETPLAGKDPVAVKKEAAAAKPKGQTATPATSSSSSSSSGSSPVNAPSTKTKTKAIPVSDESDEEPVKVKPPQQQQQGGGRKRTTAMKPSIIESDSDEDDDSDDASPAHKAKKPVKKKARRSAAQDSDDDAFVVSDNAAEDEDEAFFDDDLDEALLAVEEDGEEATPPPQKKKSAAAVKAKQGKEKGGESSIGHLAFSPERKPTTTAGGGGGGAGGKPKPKKKKMVLQPTSGEDEEEKAKKKEEEAMREDGYDFLKPHRIKDADGIRPGEEGHDPRTVYIPSSAWNKFTPFEKQFWDIKKSHYDTVLFFQKGKFFELYETDAFIGHQVFDLKITRRVTMSMVGVPETHFDFWAAKFLAQGYKVGRVDQTETALGAEIRKKDAKAGKGGKGGAGGGKAAGIVNRELKSVLTSGTITDGGMLTDDQASHCVAIREVVLSSSEEEGGGGAGGGVTIGVCVLDASTAEFSLAQLVDDTPRTQLETLFRRLKVREIIHEKGNLSKGTLRVLRSCVMAQQHQEGVECQWTALKAGTEFLGAQKARKEVEKLFEASEKKKKVKGEEEMDVDDDVEQEEESKVPESIRKMYGKEVAMSALGGMIWYLRQLNLDTSLVTNRNFNIYDPLRSGRTLVLDGQTLAHMEVLENSLGGTEGTLLQLLSRCVTPFGKRLFKIWLCTPLKDPRDINARLDAVEDLMANPEFVEGFDKLAKSLPDLERLLSRVHAKACKEKEFFKVVGAFQSIELGMKRLRNKAKEFKSEGIKALVQGARETNELLEEVMSMYDKDKDEIIPVEDKDEEYERVKEIEEGIEDELKQELKKYKKELNCELSFRDIGTKDIYQIQVPTKSVKNVPDDWTQMSKTKDFTRYWSPEVEELVGNLKEARERRGTVVAEFKYRVYAAFDEHYPTWLATVKLLAELDCLVSLSKSSAALAEPAVRPEIVDSPSALIEFEELRHPCVLNSTTDFIPNDVALGGGAEPGVALLTGPNMAGKSTLLRMTCTGVIMAQLGCFVPAAKARISPIDAIYSRMGANDQIFANASTFKVEMDDCSKILSKATPKSLVILDELGRGTSTYDGHSIAFATLHRIATHIGCIGFFATHYTKLTEDFAYHPNIRLCHMDTQVDDETRAVLFLYKLVVGISPKSYGPHVARMAGLPESIVRRAIAISKTFEASSTAREKALRANESLPLTTQADAAFLLDLAENNAFDDLDAANFIRTLEIIRKAIETPASVA